jgi:hypothetical protein
MAEWGETPRGGTYGILTTHEEMHGLAVEFGARYADEFVPIPGLAAAEQKKLSAGCYHEDVTYWEKSDGAHGWACRRCGTVVQWG